VSRIQDILAKAERDGTARRTHTESLGGSTAVVAPIEGAVALDRTPFMPPIGAPLTPPMAVEETSIAEGQPATVDVRTARATLHPALVAAIAPHSAVAEQYRAVRTRLTAREENGPLRTIMITSPGARDGKSITAANLALTMAQEFQRNVVLVDADLRKPRVHQVFKLSNRLGLVSALTGTVKPEEVFLRTEVPNLWLTPCGPLPPNPSELLESDRMRRILEDLQTEFDMVIVDSPPLPLLSDAMTLVGQVSGVIVVTAMGKVTRDELHDFANQLWRLRANVLGTVANFAPGADRVKGYYGERR